MGGKESVKAIIIIEQSISNKYRVDVCNDDIQ